MKITAPESWLDDVDVEALREWFVGRGFKEQGRWLVGACTQILLPPNEKRFTDWKDWKARLLDAIEEAARLEGITAAEWFERKRRGRPA